MHTTDQLTVGEIARRSGFAESAVRYYEKLGLLTAARTAGGQRRFERSTLRRLAFIRAARNVGLSLDEVRARYDKHHLVPFGEYLPLAGLLGQLGISKLVDSPGSFTPGDGPQQVHLVLLDNGRTAALADEHGRAALHCIKCSACLNVCPVYERTGGPAPAAHPFEAGAGHAPPLPHLAHRGRQATGTGGSAVSPPVWDHANTRYEQHNRGRDEDSVDWVDYKRQESDCQG